MIWAALLLLLAAAPAPAAELTLYGPARISLAELSVPMGVRAASLGEAYASVGGDSSSLQFNPSGLSSLPGTELSLSHHEMSSSLGVRQETLAFARPLGPGRGLGISLNYFSLGRLQGRAGDGALLSDDSPFAFGASAGYARSMLGEGRLSLGLSAEFAMESIFSSAQAGFGASLGASYALSPELRAGVALTHLGSGAGGFSPPSALSLGASAFALNRLLLFSLDASLPQSASPLLKSGVELMLGALQFRGGWRLALGAPEGDLQGGFSLGAGFVAGLFRIDYAWLPYGSLMSTHRISATLLLPTAFFVPKAFSYESNTDTSQAYYEQGMALESNGKPLEAMLQYQNAENAYPEELEAHPQPFYLAAQARLRGIQSDMERGGGDSAETKAFIRKHAVRAREYLESGRAQEALAEVRQIEAFDRSSEMVVKLRKEVESSMSSRLLGLRDEAHAALAANNLGLAVDRFLKILQVDPADGEAAAFFASRRPEIRALLTSIHRKGIDLYVAGRVLEALEVWKKGKSIDIDKGLTADFDRDIKKAKNQIGQGGPKAP